MSLPVAPTETTEDIFIRNKSSGFDVRNVNKKKLIPPRFHEDTQLSKQALKLEKKLLIELNNIMRYFSDNYLPEMNPFNYGNVYEEFRKDIENIVKNIIRSYVTKAYMLATEHITDALNVPTLITKSDITTIEELSNSFYERFLGRIRNVLNSGVEKFYDSLTDVFIPASFNRDSEDIDKNEEQLNVLVKNIERSKSYIFSSLAILIINVAVNRAVIIKAKKIILNETPRFIVPSFEAADFDDGQYINWSYEPNIDYETGNVAVEITQKTLKQKQQFYYIWKTTIDERTCSYCETLSDAVFTVDDPIIPEPIFDTHYSCRCKLVLMLS